MANTRIDLSVYEKNKTALVTKLERQRIDGLGSIDEGLYHSASYLNSSTVTSMINAFKLHSKNAKFYIEWIPPEAHSLLFTNLKKSKSTLSISLLWYIDEPRFVKTIYFQGGMVQDNPKSTGTPPRAIQTVEFTAAIKS